MKAEKYDHETIQQLIDELNSTSEGWLLEEGKLTKHYVFKDFVTAFGFMTMCAIFAEKVNHHPEWFNVYKKVKVQLTTHEVSGISQKDADLAKQMEVYARAFS